MNFQDHFFRIAIAVCLLSAIPIAGQAQNSPSNKDSRNIVIGFSISPDYSFRTLNHKDDNQAAALVIRTRNELEIAKFGYTSALNILYQCSNNVGFETGIQYSNKGYKTKERTLIYQVPDPNLPVQFSSRYSYHYVGIPLKARFDFGSGKVHIVSSVGAVTSFLVNVKQTTLLEFPNGTTQKQSDRTSANFNRIDLSPSVSLGVAYNISQEFYVTIEPSFRYGILPTMDAPVKEHLWSGGLSLGIYRKLHP